MSSHYLSPEMDIREAEIEDLDDILDIALEAFPQDPQWDYRFPGRHEFPEDTRKCTRLRYKAFFESPKGTVRIMLIMAPSLEDPSIKIPISMAIWEYNIEKPMLERRPSTDDTCDSRRDADPKRMEAFSKALSTARKTYFDDVYGTKHLHLRIMATHPKYQRRGAGTMLCKWGMTEVEKNSTRISVFASPLGKLLYTKVGFQELGVVIVQVEGEEEKLSIPAMLWEPIREKGSWCTVS